jgi:DNA-binding Lrp family transcriptional regulator
MTLIEALRMRPYSTARRLAVLMKVSVPTVHRRIKAAEKAGTQIVSCQAASKGTGPVPMEYALARKQ